MGGPKGATTAAKKRKFKKRETVDLERQVGEFRAEEFDEIIKDAVEIVGEPSDHKQVTLPAERIPLDKPTESLLLKNEQL